MKNRTDIRDDLAACGAAHIERRWSLGENNELQDAAAKELQADLLFVGSVPNRAEITVIEKKDRWTRGELELGQKGLEIAKGVLRCRFIFPCRVRNERREALPNDVFDSLLLALPIGEFALVSLERVKRPLDYNAASVGHGAWCACASLHSRRGVKRV